MSSVSFVTPKDAAILSDYNGQSWLYTAHHVLHIAGNQQTDRRHSDNSKWKTMSNLMKHWTVCHTDYCNVREGAKQHENPRWLQAFAYLFVRLVNIQNAFPG